MKPVVLCVHQIGKVGSTSVVSALQRRFPTEKIYQTHALSEAGVLNGMAWWLGRPDAPRCKFPDHLSGSLELRRRFGGGFSAARWFLLCLVRDPLLRDISAFFQNLQAYWIHRIPEKTRVVCRRVLDGKLPDEAINDGDLNELVDDLAILFINEYPVNLFDQWFDCEMRGVFGIDVFARPFPPEWGYEIYEQGFARGLLMRLEDVSRVFIPATQAWLSGSELETAAGEPLTLERERANDGGAKSYAALYRRFVGKITAEPVAVASSGSSRVARHFYPAQQIGS
jgi:hypothetical protein